MVTDMTSGRTFSVLLKFSLPMLLSVAFQQLYNIVDSVIAGNFVSDMALGAIGASYPVTMIFMAVATGGSVGASVVVARLFGSKNYTYMKTAINTALVSFAAIAGVLTVIGCALCSPMLTLLGTPDDIFADSDIYLRVYVLGIRVLAKCPRQVAVESFLIVIEEAPNTSVAETTTREVGTCIGILP